MAHVVTPNELGNLLIGKHQIPWSGLKIIGQLPEGLVVDPIKEISSLYWQQGENGHLDLELAPEDGLIILTGMGKFELHHVCVKCLESVNFSFSLDFNYHLIEGERPSPDSSVIMGMFGDEENDHTGQLEVSYFQEKIDLGAILREHLFLELPPHPACDHPLALPTQLCSFKNDFGNVEAHVVDPRFAALREII